MTAARDAFSRAASIAGTGRSGNISFTCNASAEDGEEEEDDEEESGDESNQSNFE